MTFARYYAQSPTLVMPGAGFHLFLDSAWGHNEQCLPGRLAFADLPAMGCAEAPRREAGIPESSSPDEDYWERRWQLEWERRHVED